MIFKVFYFSEENVRDVIVQGHDFGVFVNIAYIKSLLYMLHTM